MDFGKATTASHGLSPEKVVSLLGTDAAAGLGSGEAAARLESFGPNLLPASNRENPLWLLARQFKSLLVIVLLIAAVVSLAVWIIQREESLPYDTVVIMAIVLANAALGFFQEYRAEISLKKLQALSGPEATVIRGGSRMRLPAEGLVPGDLLALAAGDRIPADARVVKSASLKINESPLTGESTTVLKSSEPVEDEAPLADRTSMVYAGTAATGGRGLAVVTATGRTTEVGVIAGLIESSPRRETPLQHSLDQLGKRLALLIVAIAAVVSATGLLVSGPLTWDNALSMMLFGVALAVAAIPEGLPAVVTGALALGTQRMARRHALVRRLPAVETLGSTTAICSDKTGTLTMGEMMVREVATPSGKLTIEGAGYRPEGEVSGPPAAAREAAAMAITAAVCNDASIREDGGQWRALGTPTEASLLVMAFKLGVDYAPLKEQNPRVAEDPFSSERKKMTVVTSSGGGMAVLHTKGAPEAVLPLCSQIAIEGRVEELSDEERARFNQAAEEMASRSLRPLALATHRVGRDGCGNVSACESGMIFLGLAGISDPPRPEAAASVKACRRAGIEVFMVTGDHATTAATIAAELGIRGGLMTGPEIEKTSDGELARQVDNVRIFARVSPGHKVRIVEALQKNGHTVAVTGDGVNDAPALRRADIGVAMGMTGTDVAREAADMVLADDNFATIVAAVEEGRAIFNNIRKFVTYLLSSNAGEIMTLFLGVLFVGWLGLREGEKLLLPLLAVQILWINLVTDGLPALALGVEPKDPRTMLRPPRRRGEPVINRRIWGMIALIGSVSCLGTLFVLDSYFPGGPFTLFPGHSVAYARTMAFVVLAFFQLYNAFNSRRLRRSSLPDILGNRWLVAAVVFSVGMMASVVHIPALQRAFDTESLAPVDWLIAAAVSSLVLWSAEIMKLLARGRDWGAGLVPLR